MSQRSDDDGGSQGSGFHGRFGTPPQGSQQGSDAEDDGRVRFVEPQRALKRFAAGTGQWLDNMYTVQQMKRAHDDEHLKRMRGNWKDKKQEYNKKRQEKRQEALKDLKAKGFPIVEDDQGVLHMDVRCGRKKLPAMVSAVPLAMIQPAAMADVILLSDPDFLRNITDSIKVPERGESGFDLQGYFGVKEILVVKNVPRWGMFYHSSWDELAPASRVSNVGNARRAQTNDVIDYVAENKALAERYFYFNPEQDKWIRELEERAAKLGIKVDELAEEEEQDEAVIKVPVNRKRTGAEKDKAGVFTQNPLRIVQFMVDANIDPWKLVLGTCETTMANAKASSLASCCYAYLRNMYNKREQGLKSELFHKVLQWSFIFEKYTSVAKRDTMDRHAAQLTSPEKAANTVPWDAWQAAVYEHLKHYFVLSGPRGDQVRIRTKAEGYKPYFPLPGGRPHAMRKRFTKLDDGTRHTFEPVLLPWWRPDYNQVRAQEGTDDRPNLRELRDCVMLAVYAFLAPIRLDWATVELMTSEEFKGYLDDKEAAERAVHIGDLKFKKGFLKKNILVVKYEKQAQEEEEEEEEGPLPPPAGKVPTKIIGAFFNQMKNIKAFKKTPVEKFLDDEDKAHPKLASNVILAYLQERERKSYDSHCLLPFSTYSADSFAAPDVDEKGKKSYKCFTNQAFGERLADLAHLITGRNFTETLFRRSYITWFWRQPGNDPLKEEVWAKLLPSVHQNSKSANLGYIKAYDALVDAKQAEWKAANPGKAVPPAKVEEFRRQVVLEAEGMLEGAANFNPEVDKDDEEKNKELAKEEVRAMRDQQLKKQEQEENLKRIEGLRRSARQAAAREGPEEGASSSSSSSSIAAAQQAEEEEEEKELPAPKPAPKPAPPKVAPPAPKAAPPAPKAAPPAPKAAPPAPEAAPPAPKAAPPAPKAASKKAPPKAPKAALPAPPAPKPANKSSAAAAKAAPAQKRHQHFTRGAKKE